MIIISRHKNIESELQNACDVLNHPKGFGRLARLLYCYPEYRNLLYFRLGYGDKCFWDVLYPRDHSLVLWCDEIGPNFVLWHPLSTLLGGKIGANCTIRQNTTIGNSGVAGSPNPVIGNNVDIGCNVCIIGGVHIGNNVKIGAGSIIVKDVPDNVVVVGNPARIVRKI